MPRHIKPRISRRRKLGQRILDFVSSHQIDGNGIESVTAARRFVREHSIHYPAVIKVRRNHCTIDSFFYAEKGMFGLAYAEFNWLAFPCLSKIYKTLDKKEFFAEFDGVDWSTDEEIFKIEYAFI
jgi:hypothetical protein